MVDGVTTPRVTAVGNTWSERGTTRVLTIDTIKTESKRAFKRTLINSTTVMGFAGIIFFLI